MDERFWSKVDASGDCWEWMAARYRGYGLYGKLRAHRVAYQELVGEIPTGLHIDHLCRNKGCVNPDHMEPVPPQENVRRGHGPTATNARKTQCIHGHPFDDANTYIWTGRGRPERLCRACLTTARRTYERRRKARSAG